ncbi:MAG: glucuronate isomerase, partial [Bacilli bacterium]|nr:glucuronate isomerase [Bacilli bacterium]
MKEFMGKTFQLENKTAILLYQKYAKEMPIFDYHCHLSAKEIYENRQFNNLTEVWVVDGNYGDHYKWRAMRANGIPERYITGNASAEDKFLKWAETVPYTIGNPLYHWTHMELKHFFGITKVLSPKTAQEIYYEANK